MIFVRMSVLVGQTDRIKIVEKLLDEAGVAKSPCGELGGFLGLHSRVIAEMRVYAPEAGILGLLLC